MRTWTLAEAERDFEIIFNLAVEGEAQQITDGERSVVAMRLDLYDALIAQKSSSNSQTPNTEENDQ